MPWAFYLLLMQYGEDPFGSFPRAAIPAIIGVFLAASKLFIVNWRSVLTPTLADDLCENRRP